MGDEHHDHTAHVAPLPNPTVGRPVSLDELLAFADRHSPLLNVARSTRSRAEAARIAAGPLLPGNPELTVAVGPRVGSGDNAMNVDVSLMQPLEIAGERGKRIDAAKASKDLTDAEIEQIRWRVHCDVHAAFHRALVEKDRALLAQRVVGFQEEVLRVVERQIAAGDAPPLTLRLAQAEVAQAKQVLVAGEQASLAARIRLAQLSGWPAASPPVLAGGLDAPRDPPPLAQLTELAAERLPGLRVAGARIREAEAKAEAAAREGWPKPAIGAQYRYEGGTPTEARKDVVMGVISLPIPSFQTNQGARALARAEVTVAEAELNADRQLLAGAVAEAHSEVDAAAKRTRAYGGEILPRFEENLTLLRRSFELGEIDILALSTGRERFLRIQSDALNAQGDYFVALSNLERVVGVDLWHDEQHEEKK
jgi:cobalt-zinc-cadmium efflux system outer membrane protein